MTDENVLKSIGGDPVTFLRAFLQMRQSKDRGKLGFDHDALAWIAKAWEQAAIAAIGYPRLVDACARERARYQKLCDDLKAGQFERGESGYVFLNEHSDWPHPLVIVEAARALGRAQIASVH